MSKNIAEVKSNKGKWNNIFVDGFKFSHEKENGEKHYYVCACRKTKKCPCRLTKTGDGEYKVNGIHNHPPNPAEHQRAEVLDTIKTKAKVDSAGAQKIIAEAVGLVHSQVASNLPSMSQMGRTVNRMRNATHTIKSNATNGLQLNEMNTKTQKGENFLLYDNEDDDDRLLIFGTQQNLRILKESTAFHCDGTFDIAPPGFNQIYTVHGRYKTHLVPLIYVLAPNKKQITYDVIFENLLVHEPLLQPKRVMIDFEMAAIQSIKKSFPETEVNCCHFHLTKNIWKKIQEFGLQTPYGNDVEFAVHLRMLAALAFVPVHKVVEGYEAIVSLEFFSEKEGDETSIGKQRLLDYFESNYIGSPGRTQGTRKPARFPIPLWNMFNITILGNFRNFF